MKNDVQNNPCYYYNQLRDRVDTLDYNIEELKEKIRAMQIKRLGYTTL